VVCYAVPPLEVFHQAMEIHQRSREPSGLVGKSANQGGQPTYPWRPSGPSFWRCFEALLARSWTPRRSLLEELPRSICSIRLRGSSWRDSGATYGTISLLAMAGGSWDAGGQVMEVLWNRWKQGGGFRFSEEKKRGARFLFSLRERHRPSQN